jgi:hypothetical protein
MILPPIIIFSKHQNKAEFKNLNDSEVPSCDFPGLNNLNNLNDLDSLILSKNLLILMVGSSVSSGVFSTGATGAMAPVILRKRLIAPAVSNRNGKILLTHGTRNIKTLNTLLQWHQNDQ